jgi:hypothetical protein
MFTKAHLNLLRDVCHSVYTRYVSALALPSVLDRAVIRFTWWLCSTVVEGEFDASPKVFECVTSTPLEEIAAAMKEAMKEVMFGERIYTG